MRIFRILLTGLIAAIALMVGLFVAAIGLIALAFSRLVGRPRTQPSPSPHANAGGSRARAMPVDSGDVIDVTATEVPADSARR